jgi:Mn2+/Fe2+ NRAMP family transporter
MKKSLEVALGVVTSIGGFIDAGAIATSAQAGARFGFELLWAVLLGTLCVIALIEMSGRLAIVSKVPLRELIHKRFGLSYSFPLLAAGLALNLMVLAAEIGGMSMAMQLATGVAFRWWALPAALFVLALLWSLTFGVIEKGVSFAGLITVVFVVCAVKLHPDPATVLAGLKPSIPSHDPANYWYIAVGVIGSIIMPYMLFFYSSGALEEKWNRSYLGVNRAVAVLGMSFGAVISMGIIVVAAGVLGPKGIRVEHYPEAAGMLVPLIGKWGAPLFICSLGIASLGAAMEVSLSAAYEIAQCLGWNWGKQEKPSSEARFTLSYSILLIAGAVPILLGIDPLSLTVFTMALGCVVLPFVAFPFLILMNDRVYLGRQTNRRWSNIVVVGIVAVTFVLAIVAIPLQIAGG